MEKQDKTTVQIEETRNDEKKPEVNKTENKHHSETQNQREETPSEHNLCKFVYFYFVYIYIWQVDEAWIKFNIYFRSLSSSSASSSIFLRSGNIFIVCVGLHAWIFFPMNRSESECESERERAPRWMKMQTRKNEENIADEEEICLYERYELWNELFDYTRMLCEWDFRNTWEFSGAGFFLHLSFVSDFSIWIFERIFPLFFCLCLHSITS